MPYKYHILTQLNKYKGKDKNRQHMPGHKNSGEFKLRFPVAPIDFTELEFSDDLNCPIGIIKQAQDDLAQILGAERAYITTDGSSSGVMAMVFTAAAYGSKLIVPRSSHKSVFNACRLLNVEPVIVQGEQREGVLLPPSAELVEELLAGDKTIAGMLATSPDYYGNIAPLECYAEAVKKHGRLLFVDGAHGAHLGIEEGRQGYAGAYADMWVDGAHKTLPTLTQGAIVLVKKEELIPRAEEGLSIFRTTSPSYPIMASVEYGVKYFVNHPRILARVKAAVDNLKSELPSVKFYPSDDWAKLALDCKELKVSPDLVQAELEKRGIYAELNDGRYILFYLSPSTDISHLAELRGALAAICTQKKLHGTYKKKPLIPEAERTFSFLYAYKRKAEWVPLKKAVGRMCADNAGITPPCLPVVIAGEIITEEAVVALSSARETFGISNGKIKVVKS